MAVKRIKKGGKLIAKGRVRGFFSKRHYNHVYLWGDVVALMENTVDTDDTTLACYCPAMWWVNYHLGHTLVAPKLGEYHFVTGEWNIEIVAHEVQHAIIHRMRALPPDIVAVNLKEDLPAIYGVKNCEELICYEAGATIEALYNWLTEWCPKGSCGIRDAKDHRRCAVKPIT